MANKLVSCLSLVFLLFFTGCSVKPLVQVSGFFFPHLEDDAEMAGLQQTIERSLHYLDRLPENSSLHFGDSHISQQRLRDTLITFREILSADPTPRELSEHIKKKFVVYQVAGVSGFNPFKKMLITGYYEPIIEGSLQRRAPFLYPLLSVPPDLVVRDKKEKQKKEEIGRFVDGRFVPYWTRREIETFGIGMGSELVWLQDPLDAFFLQVQGSGRIRLRNGELRGVHYKISNGRKYRSIGKYMVDTGRITLKEASLQTIRNYITANPDERDGILYHNEKFIFFDWTDTLGAIGSLGEILTPGRSVAADQKLFPAGGLGFIKTKSPVMESDGTISGWQPLQRFVLVQDKGSAIKGTGRIDFFWGHDTFAETSAGLMKEPGKFYLLVKKDHDN